MKAMAKTAPGSGVEYADIHTPLITYVSRSHVTMKRLILSGKNKGAEF